MNVDELDSLRGYSMSSADVDRFLTEVGWGHLSLARDGVAYTVPISFGYDGGDRLYFFLIRFGDESTKADFADATETATFAVAEVDSKDRWRSVLVRGRLEDVPEEDIEGMEASMKDNAWSARLFPFGEPITEVRRAQLVVESATGQQGPAYGE